MAIHVAPSGVCCIRRNIATALLIRHGHRRFDLAAPLPDLMADPTMYTTYHQYDASVTSWDGLEEYVPVGPWSMTINRYDGSFTGYEFVPSGVLQSQTVGGATRSRTYNVYVFGSILVATYTVDETMTDAQTWADAKGEVDTILAAADFDNPIYYDMAHYFNLEWGYSGSAGAIGSPPDPQWFSSGSLDWGVFIPGDWRAEKLVGTAQHPYYGAPYSQTWRLPKYCDMVAVKQRVRLPGKYRRKTYESDYDVFQWAEANYTGECVAVDDGCLVATFDCNPPAWSSTDTFHGYKWEAGLTCS